MIVLGLSFGDEGKGLTTSFLCSQAKNPLVVRFNGGHQAGHTVVYNGKRHVFSSFGSGTLQGVPTYWSSYCTFDPTSFLNEYYLLPNARIFVNPLCPVTTPFDVADNQRKEMSLRHGSVGVGFGSTIQRQESNYKLYVQDLYHKSVLTQKLNLIAQYYGLGVSDDKVDAFLKSVELALCIIKLEDDSIMHHFDPIFEGAQGILLDMDFGFFPNVTRSNTTSKNALQMYDSKEVYYVTRSYLTRHGNGFLPNEKKLPLVNNENETNQPNKYQGKFRTAELDVDLLNYSLRCDSNFSLGLKKNLVITCLDQYPIDVDHLLKTINTSFNKVFVSTGDSLADIIQVR